MTYLDFLKVEFKVLSSIDKNILEYCHKSLYIFLQFFLFFLRLLRSTFLFSFFYLFRFLKIFHWKIIYIFLDEVTLTSTFASLSTSTLSFLHPILHHNKIYIFYMFYMIRFDFVIDICCYLFIVCRDIEIFVKALQEFEVFFLFPWNACPYSPIFSQLNKIRLRQ